MNPGPYVLRSLLLLALFEFGCGQAPHGLAENQVVSAPAGDVQFRVETVASGLEVPWAFAFLPNGNMLFTERPGRIRIIENGKLRPEPVFTVPDVEPSGESGLMDISLHPDFATNGFVYISYAYSKDGRFVRVARYKFDGKTFSDPAGGAVALATESVC